MAFQVLFVCTGNTCRSPMAEGLLKALLPESIRSEVRVSSAGTMGNGYPVTDLAWQACEKINVDISRHRSRHLTEPMIDESDLILTMTEGHKHSVLYLQPRAHKKTFTLSEYAGLGIRDIQDPFGGDFVAYQIARDEILVYIRQVLPQLEEMVLKKKEPINATQTGQIHLYLGPGRQPNLFAIGTALYLGRRLALYHLTHSKTAETMSIFPGVNLIDYKQLNGDWPLEDTVILENIDRAIAEQLITIDQLSMFLKTKEPHVELILTAASILTAIPDFIKNVWKIDAVNVV